MASRMPPPPPRPAHLPPPPSSPRHVGAAARAKSKAVLLDSASAPTVCFLGAVYVALFAVFVIIGATGPPAVLYSSNAAADLESATARVEVTGRQRALAEEAAKVAQRSYENGTVDARDVLDALDRLDLARNSEVDARARLGMADAALRAATGKW